MEYRKDFRLLIGAMYLNMDHKCRCITEMLLQNSKCKVIEEDTTETQRKIFSLIGAKEILVRRGLKDDIQANISPTSQPIPMNTILEY